MKIVSVCCLFVSLAPAWAESPDAKSAASPFTYSASGTCLASPGGFNAKLEPVNTGVAWTTSFTSNGTVDDHGAATEVGQSVDTASFGVGPRMHSPAAHAYNSTFSVSISETADNEAVFRAGAANGTFTAGPLAGRSFGLSGFELKRLARHEGTGVYGGASPVTQTVALAGGAKFERVCALTVSVYPRR
jgi:hypothetical protein